jgi:hypothetical protein
MVSMVGFGKKLKVPSTAQIKHQLLMLWLKDQTRKEAAEGIDLDSKKDGATVPNLNDAVR